MQAFERSSFALTASFSPTGKWLGLGNSNDNYSVIRLGPLLGINLVPLTLKAGVSQLPRWALNETIYRSGYGPCLIQRHMTQGGQDSMQWVATTLKEHPDAIYTFDRSQNEGCFETALRLRKIKLLKIAVTTIVDGTLEGRNKNCSILTTAIPEIGQTTLQTMLDKHPPEFIVEILKLMTFVKVPFTKPHPVSREKRMVSVSGSRFLVQFLADHISASFVAVIISAAQARFILILGYVLECMTTSQRKRMTRESLQERPPCSLFQI